MMSCLVDVLLTRKDLESIESKYTKLAGVKSSKGTLVYRTLKKKRGSCIFFKNGRCTAKHKPFFCQVHPFYFTLNFADGSIVWQVYSKRKRKLPTKVKKALLSFLKEEEPKTIAVYLLKTEKLSLMPIEEERIPIGLIKKVKKVKKFL